MTDREPLPNPAIPHLVRRAIHAVPELGFCEIRTSDLAWRILETLGWTLTEGPTREELAGYAGLPSAEELDAAVKQARADGVDERAIERFGGGATGFSAQLDGNRPGPTVALRLDLDALPITESARSDHRPAAEGFASRRAGRMHACGHDGHIAIGLLLAHSLSANRDFAGRVRLIFQPAEEGVRGAAPLVATGVCDDVDVLLALHLGFGVPRGAVAPATELYATTKFRVDFTGTASHASKAPEHGRNALLAAASATLSLHALAPFASTATRVNVGSLLAPGASNIVPAMASLAAEVRAATDVAHAELERRALGVFTGAAIMHGVECETAITGQASAAITDESLITALTEVAEQCGIRALPPQPFGASDDASLMMRRVQERGGRAAYYLVGAGDFGAHHSPTFDFDESVLDAASRFVEVAIRSGRLGQTPFR